MHGSGERCSFSLCRTIPLLISLSCLQDGPDADAAQAEEAAAAGKGKRGKQERQQAEQGKKGKKGKKGKQGEEAVDAAKQAELEMLLMDDAALMAAARGGGGGASAPAGNQQQGQQQRAAAKPKMSRKERIRLKKEARRRERQEGSDEEDAAGGWYWGRLGSVVRDMGVVGLGGAPACASEAVSQPCVNCQLPNHLHSTALPPSSCSRRGRRLPRRGPVGPALCRAAHLAPLRAGPNRPAVQVSQLPAAWTGWDAVVDCWGTAWAMECALYPQVFLPVCCWC